MRRPRRGLLVGFVVLASAAWTPKEHPALAALVCQRRNGALVLRDACKRRERPADLQALGALGPKGPAGAGLRLVDSTGAPAGLVVNIFGEEDLLLYRVGDQAVISVVDTNGLVVRTRFVFESADCSGPRLVRDASQEDFFRFVGVFDQAAHYAGEPIGPHAIASVAEPPEAGLCAGAGGTLLSDGLCCYVTTPSMVNAGPAVRADLPALGVPPFRLDIVR